MAKNKALCYKIKQRAVSTKNNYQKLQKSVERK